VSKQRNPPCVIYSYVRRRMLRAACPSNQSAAFPTTHCGCSQLEGIAAVLICYANRATAGASLVFDPLRAAAVRGNAP
jgi:hypothetical protein